MKFEYQQIEISSAFADSNILTVNQLGKDGWELISAYQLINLNTLSKQSDVKHHHVLWFKREILEDSRQS